MDSYEPISEPVPDIWPTKSTNSFSITVEETEPRLDMTWEISLISSSSSIFQICSEFSSPSESMMTAARSAPVRERTSSLICGLFALDMD